MLTAYVIVTIHFEERDLRRSLGSVYQEYQKRVPMRVPWRRVTTPRA
jgi:protein-S-isoprenylcysteine O-methyltransferase Ste14